MDGRSSAARVAAGAAAFLAAGLLVGSALGMHRGLLLSDGIRGWFWPWAPTLGRPVLAPSAAALSDPVWQFVPWVELARAELGAGRLPLWNPHQEAGQPLLGNGQSALGSPLLWPALALPLFPGWNLSLLLRVLVSAAGGWALARDDGRTRAAALLAASVCGLSGPFVAWLEHPQTLTAAAVPWLLLAVRRAARGGSLAPSAAVAGATALVLAGGHHETALMAALLAGATPIRWTRTLLLLPIPAALLAARGLDRLAERAARGARGAAPALALAVAAGCGAELLAAARGVHAVTPPGARRLATPILDVLASDRSVFRVLPLHTFLPPGTATSLGIDDLRGYDALAVRAFRASREEVGRFRGVPTLTDVVEPWDLVPGGAGLDGWNVKYLLLHPQFAFSAREMNARLGLDLVERYAGPDGKLLENRRVRPRARVEREGRTEGSVEVVARSATRWLLDVATPSGGTLVVANAGYPGWEATVGGARAGISGGVGRRQEVPVPAGRVRVELAYRPLSFRLGLALAAASAAVLALLAAAGRKRVQRR